VQSHEIDRPIEGRIVRHLLSGDFTQGQLAESLGVKPTAIHRSVARLVDSGLVRLQREGVEQLPRLTLFDKLAELETGIRLLREATT
jgi:predicted ArsR family transcriptional regulator